MIKCIIALYMLNVIIIGLLVLFLVWIVVTAPFIILSGVMFGVPYFITKYQRRMKRKPSFRRHRFR